MSNYAKTSLFLALLSCLSIIMSLQSTSARILKKCDVAKELRRSKVVDKSFVAHLVCVMQYESKFNTSLVKGPGSRSSYSYGVFQISSEDNKWCSRFRVGGACNKKCQDFIDDDIQDDIVCANLIFQKEGLKHWPGWVKNCKNGKLPSLVECKSKRCDDDDDHDDDDDEEDEERLEDEEFDGLLDKVMASVAERKRNAEKLAGLELLL